jgi:hypothetical protein
MEGIYVLELAELFERGAAVLAAVLGGGRKEAVLATWAAAGGMAVAARLAQRTTSLLLQATPAPVRHKLGRLLCEAGLVEGVVECRCAGTIRRHRTSALPAPTDRLPAPVRACCRRVIRHAHFWELEPGRVIGSVSLRLREGGVGMPGWCDGGKEEVGRADDGEHDVVARTRALFFGGADGLEPLVGGLCPEDLTVSVDREVVAAGR